MAKWMERKRSRLWLSAFFRILVILGLVAIIHQASSFFLGGDTDANPISTSDRTLFPAGLSHSLQHQHKSTETSIKPPSDHASSEYADSNPIDQPKKPDAKQATDKSPDSRKPAVKKPTVKKPTARKPNAKKLNGEESTVETKADKADATLTASVFQDSVNHNKHPATSPSANDPSKAIVVSSTTNEKTGWWHEYFSDWDLNIYVVDDPTAELTVVKNKGRESGVYLTYIIDHYDELPDIIVFSHAQRYQWHSDDPMYDSVGPLKRLQLPYVQEQGYVSLRCAWYPSCPVSVRPDLNADQGFFGTVKTYAHAFQRLFPNEEIPEEVGAPCCSQFAVSREQVRKRPVADYMRYRNWLWESNVPGGKTGRVFEFTWHLIFLQPLLSCKPVAQCYCKTFGLCNLKCPDKSHCLGRYSPPPINKHFPAGWPHPEKQVKGFVTDKWWEKFYPPEEWDGFEPRNKTQFDAKAAPETKAKQEPKVKPKLKTKEKPKAKEPKKTQGKPKAGLKAKLKPALDSLLNWKPRPDLVHSQGG